MRNEETMTGTITSKTRRGNCNWTCHYMSVVISSIKCIQMNDASQGVLLAFMVYRTVLKLPNFCHENHLGLVTLILVIYAQYSRPCIEQSTYESNCVLPNLNAVYFNWVV
jgi:hypothetical protein